uniref:Uncharacterized protein n=1 Tax=Oryza punctata TaxID=4537 RepID=A0A0E0JG04_ORYPU
MEFGRRKSFSFFEEDWKARPAAAAAAAARTPVHHHYARSPAREAVPHTPPRLSLSSVHGVELPGGRVRAWAAPGCFNRGYLDVGRGRVPAIAACGGTLVTSHSRDHHVRVWTVCASAVCDHIRAKKAATLPAKGGILSFTKRRPPHHRDTVSCLVLHAVAGLLYTASHDHTVKAWKLSDGSCADSFVAHDGAINAMLINEADGCIFTGSADGTVKMWRRVYGGTTHALIIVLRSELSPVNALTLCHAATTTTRRCFLYAGSSDGYVNVWEKEASAGRPAHAGFLKGHRLAVFCLTSGCSGRVVVSGSEDATMRVWRRDGKGGSTSHTCLAVIEGHRGPVRCLAVGGGEAGEVEGSMVVYSAGLDKSVKVWRIRVVGKEEEEDDDEDDLDDDDNDGVVVGEEEAAEMSPAAGKDTEARDEAAAVVVAEEEAEVVVGLGATPVLSPVWVEKRRTSRG